MYTLSKNKKYQMNFLPTNILPLLPSSCEGEEETGCNILIQFWDCYILYTMNNLLQ